MKKLLFTALAVVAFSGVAMANSVEVEELTTLKNEIKVVIIQQEENSFQAAAIAYYEQVMENRGGGEDTLLLSSLMYNCLN